MSTRADAQLGPSTVTTKKRRKAERRPGVEKATHE